MRRFLRCAALVTLAVGMTACDPGGCSEKDGQSSEYFPNALDTHWTYDIKVPDIERTPPLTHMVYVVAGDAGERTVRESRGELELRQKTADQCMRLEFTIAKAAGRQGPLQWREGRELAVTRDDLGIFEKPSEFSGHARKIFWAKNQNADVMQVTAYYAGYYAGERPQAVTSGDREALEGYSKRIIFFGGDPGTAKGLLNQNDEIRFVARETHDGMECMHFRRTVSGDKTSDSWVDHGFDEDIWFAKGIGLESLVQHVDGKETMSWRIVAKP